MTAAAAGKPVSTPTVVLGFILSTVLTGLVTCAVGMYGGAYQADRAEQSAKVDKFADAALAYDGLVKRFVVDVSKGRVSDPTRQAIRANLETQRSALENVGSIHELRASKLFRDYNNAILAADTGIKQGTGPLNTKQFAQASADMAAERPALLKALRKHPLLPSLS